jgi:hypothetical protein
MFYVHRSRRCATSALFPPTPRTDGRCCGARPAYTEIVGGSSPLVKTDVQRCCHATADRARGRLGEDPTVLLIERLMINIDIYRS